MASDKKDQVKNAIENFINTATIKSGKPEEVVMFFASIEEQYLKAKNEYSYIKPAICTEQDIKDVLKESTIKDIVDFVGQAQGAKHKSGVVEKKTLELFSELRSPSKGFKGKVDPFMSDLNFKGLKGNKFFDLVVDAVLTKNSQLSFEFGKMEDPKTITKITNALSRSDHVELKGAQKIIAKAAKTLTGESLNQDRQEQGLADTKKIAELNKDNDVGKAAEKLSAEPQKPSSVLKASLAEKVYTGNDVKKQ